MRARQRLTTARFPAVTDSFIIPPPGVSYGHTSPRILRAARLHDGGTLGADTALITSSGSELVFQTHKDLGGVTYQIGAAGTLAIHDGGAANATVVLGPHAWFSVMGDVHQPPAVADDLKIEPRVPTAI